VTVDLGLQLNIGRVMNLAAKAGMPKVDKAYPSMALGTAEATPLSVATAYTMFANLGDRVLPMPITQITQGDGSVVASPTPDRKPVVRPEVAYIMADILKDIINRGTAAQAQGWGFRNVDGKAAFAGKTGTSRDGWFAGFTPEIVCVVYVGFDDGDDLGMKGSDSAMPIWADFMQAALRLHPEWNGDWTMPANVRRAEIDIRNGALIRELDSTEASAPREPEKPKPSAPEPTGNELPAAPDLNSAIPVPAVPPEFRRIELFISGTIPTPKSIAPDEDFVYDPETGQTIPRESPTASPSPLGETRQDDEDSPDDEDSERDNVRREMISVSICTLTGMRATSNCPERSRNMYRRGTEPKDFCTFHVNPPR
jgi:membrane peptidoglycan carboxypeptidase